LGFICRRQELGDLARERYGTLDQMNSELRWLREQRDALNALVEALRTDNGWLVYRAEALRDQLLELDAKAAEGSPPSRRCGLRSWTGMRCCRGRGRTWRRRALWQQSGRLRWPRFVPNFNKTARPSKERVLGNARPRRRPRRRRS
jgi:hypothetical protein